MTKEATGIGQQSRRSLVISVGARVNRVEEEAAAGKEKAGKALRWAQLVYLASVEKQKEDEEEVKWQHKISQSLPAN